MDPVSLEKKDGGDVGVESAAELAQGGLRERRQRKRQNSEQGA